MDLSSFYPKLGSLVLVAQVSIWFYLVLEGTLVWTLKRELRKDQTVWGSQPFRDFI